MKLNKKVIGICIFLIIFTIISIIIYKTYHLNNSNNNSYEFLEKYDSNQFIPLNITNEDMAKKYLNDYKNNMLSDVDEAYNSLNKDYREKKFKNIEGYKEYVKNSITLSTFSLEVDKYNIFSVDGYKAFNIYDKNGNQYIFKEISIMNYEVYLDDYTIKLN